MYAIEMTEEFDNWLRKFRDGKTQKVIVKRIRSMSLGTLGDVRPLDGSLFEAKIHYGPGYRLYFVNQGMRAIILLCGGGKSTQKRDIARARELAKEI
jgi:putative addiction module killer protein